MARMLTDGEENKWHPRHWRSFVIAVLNIDSQEDDGYITGDLGDADFGVVVQHFEES